MCTVEDLTESLLNLKDSLTASRHGEPEHDRAHWRLNIDQLLASFLLRHFLTLIWREFRANGYAVGDSRQTIR